MSRVLLSGALALGALGAVLGFTPGVPTADAAPSMIRFAGTYAEGSSSDPITISGRGHIASSYSSPDSRFKFSRSGWVGDDGSYSYTLRVTSAHYDDRRDRTTWHTSRYELAGVMALDADGNIVGTPDDGDSFVWFRQ
jgi:hypothetical protein